MRFTATASPSAQIHQAIGCSVRGTRRLAASACAASTGCAGCGRHPRAPVIRVAAGAVRAGAPPSARTRPAPISDGDERPGRVDSCAPRAARRRTAVRSSSTWTRPASARVVTVGLRAGRPPAGAGSRGARTGRAGSDRIGRARPGGPVGRVRSPTGSASRRVRSMRRAAARVAVGALGRVVGGSATAGRSGVVRAQRIGAHVRHARPGRAAEVGATEDPQVDLARLRVCALRARTAVRPGAPARGRRTSTTSRRSRAA